MLATVTLLVSLATSSAVAQEGVPSSSFEATDADQSQAGQALGLVESIGWILARAAIVGDLVRTQVGRETVPTPRQALQCDRKRVHSVRNEWGYLSGFESPRRALQIVLEEGFVIPVRGYRELALDDDAVLFGFSDRGRVKVAVRVTETSPGRWIPEWLADCPLSEYGRNADMGPGVWLWSDRRNRTIQERRGPAHCRLRSVRTLWWTGPSADRRDDRLYIRDPEGQYRDQWRAPYLRFTSLPASARDTGYRRDGSSIWMAADGDSIYIVRGRNVQRWPRVPRNAIGCA